MNDIVVEVRGGVVVGVYSNLPAERLVVVDWDDIADGGDTFVWRDGAPLSLMPKDTCGKYQDALSRDDIRQATPTSS